MLKIINSTMANRYRHMGAIAALACSLLILSSAAAEIGQGSKSFPQGPQPPRPLSRQHMLTI